VLCLRLRFRQLSFYCLMKLPGQHFLVSIQASLLSGTPFISVVEATDLRQLNDFSGDGRLNGPGFRRLLGQRQMCPGAVIQISNTKHIRPRCGKFTILGTLSTGKRSRSVLSGAGRTEGLPAVILIATWVSGVSTFPFGCLTP
jgi:hypothetical protein